MDPSKPCLIRAYLEVWCQKMVEVRFGRWALCDYVWKLMQEKEKEIEKREREGGRGSTIIKGLTYEVVM